MATFKALCLAHQRKNDGTYNVKIRVSNNRSSVFIATQWHATRKELKGSGSILEIKSPMLCDLCNDLIRQYRNIVYQHDTSLMTAREVADIIARHKDSNERWELDFFEYAEQCIAELVSEGRTGTAHVRRSMLNSLERFVGSRHFDICGITRRFLCDWMKFIDSMPSSKGDGKRRQMLYLYQLKPIYERAKDEFNDEDNGIIRVPNIIFNKVAVARPDQPRKRSLTLEQIRRLLTEDMVTRSKNAIEVLDVFRLSFYLIGMNAIDIALCKDYADGRINYNRHKTMRRRDDRAQYSVLVPEEALSIVERYRGVDSVFDFADRCGGAQNFCNRVVNSMPIIAEYFGIDGLTFYAARHTWATIAVNEVGVDKYIVHSALNHSDPAMRVTDMYIRKDWHNIDEANRKVIDYVLGK